MTDELPRSAETPRKTKVFISYSRVDSGLAKRIAAILEKRGLIGLIDVSATKPSEKWWKRILIRAASTSTACGLDAGIRP